MMWNELTSNLYSFFIGGLVMLVVYHLFIFIQNKQWFYFNYSMYMLCLSIYLLQWNVNMGNESPYTFTRPMFMCASGGFYLNFVNEIIGFKKLDIRWNRILKKAAFYSFVITGIVGAVYFIFPNGFSAQVVAYNIAATAYIIFVSFVFVKLFKLNNPYARYLLFGSMLYFLGATTTFALNFFISIPDFSRTYGFQLLSFTILGILFEALIFALIIGFKNSQTEKAKLLAQHNERLEAQKVINLIKDQELNAINAMIEGQEKERQRLASDLHDSVGAILSAAKLQFQHLVSNKNRLDTLDELFQKTGTLLDDAYTEVRSMAHLKNSGVIAKMVCYRLSKNWQPMLLYQMNS